jgi:hypothetical protein
MINKNILIVLVCIFKNKIMRKQEEEDQEKAYSEDIKNPFYDSYFLIFSSFFDYHQ